MADKLSVGVVGAGTIARSHIKAIGSLDNIRLAAVMDPDGERARAEAGPRGARAYEDLESLLADPGVEAVHVCSPHNVHGDQVVAAAGSGKHVLVEKPMALTLAECDRMIEAAESADVVLMVGQVMRHSPINLKAREMIAEGAIGTVGHQMRRRLSAFNPAGDNSTYGAWYMDLEVGGVCVLYCFGPHEYDMLHWYIGSPVVDVYARGTEGSELYPGQKDTYSALLTHQNGCVSALSQSVACGASAQDHTIVGSNGSMAITTQRLVVDGKEMPVTVGSGEAMENQVREFASCCLEGRTPEASGKNVRHTMAVIEAAKQSADSGKPVLVSELD